LVTCSGITRDLLSASKRDSAPSHGQFLTDYEPGPSMSEAGPSNSNQHGFWQEPRPRSASDGPASVERRGDGPASVERPGSGPASVERRRR
jgi:hypothetical protein